MVKNMTEFVEDIVRYKLGGEGSGYFGHAGRPGEVGGSGEGGSQTVSAKEAIPLTPSEGYKESLSKELRSRISKEGRGLGTPDIWYALGYRDQSDESFAMAEHVEKASDRETMLKVLGSQSNWATNWVDPDEWQAAEALGGNGSIPKVAEDEIKDGKGIQIDDAMKKGFEARQKYVVETLRKKYGDAITVYRGVSGTYAKKIKTNYEMDLIKGNEIEVPVHTLSSWTSNQNRARDFAFGYGPSKGKKGVVFKATVPVEQFWLANDIGPKGVIKFSDDAGELVLKSTTKIMKVKASGGTFFED